MAKQKKDADAPEAKKPEKLQAPRGTQDLLPAFHQYYTVVKKVVRHRARQAGFRRITTPVLESRELFERSLGETAEAASKEMYKLTTAGGTELAMKPEGTAGVARAFIQNGMGSWPQPVELYYIEPHFRHDRPQRGRYRQFHQFGFEVLGESDPALDVQIIQIAKHIYDDLKVGHRLKLHLNTLGSLADREKYLDALRDYFTGKERILGDHGMELLEKNPLRLLDSKDEDIKILAGMAPKMEQFLSDESKDFYAKVKELLDELEIEYVEDSALVRGLDYYAHTVFEFVADDGLAAGGGGRYDGLIEQLGGTPTPGMGFAAGVERVIHMMQDEDLEVPNKDQVDIFVAQLGWEAKREAIKILAELRELGVHTMGAVGTASMKAQLNKADKFDAKYAVILGEVEVREGRVIIRDMHAGKQEIFPLDKVVKEVVKKIGAKNLDTYDPSKDITKKAKDPADEFLIVDEDED